MHLEKPSLAKHLQDPQNRGYAVLQKIFFAPTTTSQAAGEAFIARLMQRKDDRDPPSGPNVAKAQISRVSRVGALHRRALRRLERSTSSHAGRAGLP